MPYHMYRPAQMDPSTLSPRAPVESGAMGGSGQMDPALIELLMEAMRSQQPAGQREPGRIPPAPGPATGGAVQNRQQPGGQPARVRPSAMASPPRRPPVDPAAIMRMMMGTAGQGVDPRAQRQPAGKIAGSPMRGTQYGQDIAARAAPGSVRSITNAPNIPYRSWAGEYGPEGQSPFSRMADFAGRNRGQAIGAVGQGMEGGLSASEEMSLKQNGFVDAMGPGGMMRYTLNRDGTVTQSRAPGASSRFGATSPIR
jgi:hypothetical protein